jgi:hypothetical protein
VIARWSAQNAFVVTVENACETRHVSRPQVSVADWRDEKVSDQGIGI